MNARESDPTYSSMEINSDYSVNDDFESNGKKLFVEVELLDIQNLSGKINNVGKNALYSDSSSEDLNCSIDDENDPDYYANDSDYSLVSNFENKQDSNVELYQNSCSEVDTSRTENFLDKCDSRTSTPSLNNNSRFSYAPNLSSEMIINNIPTSTGSKSKQHFCLVRN